MNKSTKKSIEKTKKSIEKTVKEIKSVEKKVESLKTINNVSKNIKTPVTIKSEKFNRWVKTLGYGARKIMYALPLILFRVCSLLVINKTLYKNIIKKYDAVNTSKFKSVWIEKDKKRSLILKELPFIEKVYAVLSMFFNELVDKPVTFLAEIVLLTTIFLDDIPSIFNSENYKLKDLEKIRKIDILSNTAKKYLEAADVYTSEAKQQENNKIQGKFNREMDRFDQNLTDLQGHLEIHKVALDCLATIKNPTSPYTERKPGLTMQKKTEILKSHIPKPKKVVLEFPDNIKNLDVFKHDSDDFAFISKQEKSIRKNFPKFEKGHPQWKNRNANISNENVLEKTKYRNSGMNDPIDTSARGTKRKNDKIDNFDFLRNPVSYKFNIKK